MNATTNFEEQIERLRARLARPLPGVPVCMTMAPENRRHMPVAQARAEGCREGGVLALLYPLEGETHVVLTRRNERLRTHAGQISFPGGRLDPGEDARTAALREAWEELGIIADALDILGALSQLYIPPSNYCLTPIVAATHFRPDFDPHDAEVAELIEVPMRAFCDPALREVETRTIEGEPRRIPFYRIGPHKVWGATAMILSELAAAWEEA